MRHLALAANVAYIAGLLFAAYNTYVQGHRPPSGPLADWAAFDAAFMTLLAGAIVLYAAAHALVVRSWWRGGGVRGILLMTLPLAGILAFAWLVYGRFDAPGWQVFALALSAAATSILAGRAPAYAN